MLDSLLPHYTYRRLFVRVAYQWLRGQDSPGKHLTRENLELFRRYARGTFTCNVCGSSGRPFFDFPDLELRRAHRIGQIRETLQCQTCGATMRHRTLVTGLLRTVGRALGRPFSTIEDLKAHGLASIAVLDADAFSPTSKRLRVLPSYAVSSYEPDKAMGTLLGPNHHNINLERIDFPDESFDIVLTSDVMEHVRDVDAAHREIARVLKPGGHYIFTVPYDPACTSHHVLVDTTSGTDRFVVPPQYHGDPLTGGVLAYRVFGQGLMNDLHKVGLEPEFHSIDDTPRLIVGGDLFIARKGAAHV